MYPRTITIENDKLKRLMVEKGQIVEQGRALSAEIDVLTVQMKEVEDRIMELEKTADVKDLKDRAEVLTKQMNDIILEMEQVKKDTFNRIKLVVPQDQVANYDELKKNKEVRENELKKLALKVQKWNDKIIPIVQSYGKRLLENEFEDLASPRIEDDKVLVDVYSHLEDFKNNYRKKGTT